MSLVGLCRGAMVRKCEAMELDKFEVENRNGSYFSKVFLLLSHISGNISHFYTTELKITNIARLLIFLSVFLFLYVFFIFLIFSFK